MTNELDVPAAEMIEELHDELRGVGVDLVLSRVHGPVRDLLESSGVADVIGRTNLYPGIAIAVLAVDEASRARVESSDVGAIIASLHQLAEYVDRHHHRLTEDQRTSLRESAEALEAIVDREDS